MEDSVESSVDKRRDRSESRPKQPPSKLFITNIDGKADLTEVENELRRLFEKHGEVDNLVVKRNRNSEYCFAFAQMKSQDAASQCVRDYAQCQLGGKQIKVEFQNDSKRRTDSNKGCYNCGKMGHFARECHSARQEDSRGGGYRRSPSPSEDSDRHRRHKHKKRNRSHSSERGRRRSRSPRKQKSRKRDDSRRGHSGRHEQKSRRKHKRDHSSDS